MRTSRSAQAATRVTIYAALAGNLAIAVTKFSAALWSGSGAMMSEAIHSIIDTGNEALLLYGLACASKKPDRRHPFGYGMEFYFWAFVVSLVIFALGGVLTIYEGVDRLRHPVQFKDPWINYIVLISAFIFEFTSFRIAWREVRKAHPTGSLWRAILISKDPGIFSVLLEDFSALIGLIIASGGFSLALLLDELRYDAVASIAIGVLLIGISIVIAGETRSLLIGESAGGPVVRHLRTLIMNDSRVQEVGEVLTMHFGPHDILAAVSVDFEDNLTAAQVESAIEEMTDTLRAEIPEIGRLFMRPMRRRSA